MAEAGECFQQVQGLESCRGHSSEQCSVYINQNGYIIRVLTINHLLLSVLLRVQLARTYQEEFRNDRKFHTCRQAHRAYSHLVEKEKGKQTSRLIKLMLAAAHSHHSQK
jgi:hypothetical protein